MADVSSYLLDARADCDECDWSTEGKNAMGNAAQHADKEGHKVSGELYRSFDVDPEP